jgi:hypothetical protein
MSFLRKSLIGNGVFSLLAGLVATVFAGSLADYMGAPAVVLHVVGIGTALFAVTILFATRRADVDLRFSLGVIAADITWAVASLVILAIPATLTREGKLLLAAVSSVVGTLAVLQIIGSVRAGKEDPKAVGAEIEIGASPDQVWAVLSDIDSWHAWNPWITEASGSADAGEQLVLRMGFDGGRKFNVKPLVTASVPNQTLEWLGHFGVNGLFDGRHRFDLEPTGGGTRFVQAEEFAGLLVPLLDGMLEGETKTGFGAMNKALKERVEAEMAVINGA